MVQSIADELSLRDIAQNEFNVLLLSVYIKLDLAILNFKQ